MSEDLVNRALTGLLVAQQSITQGLGKTHLGLAEVRGDLIVVGNRLGKLETGFEELKTSSERAEGYVHELIDVVGNMATGTSVGTQQRLSSLEAQVEELQHLLALAQADIANLKPAS